MNCIEVTTVDDAMKKLPSSVVPIEGLRRDNEGNLTRDALRTVIDGLKSRGIDPTDAVIRVKLQDDLASLLCSLNNQYSFLLKELFRGSNSKELMDALRDKNITMQDVINVSRHLDGIQPLNDSGVFIEGWQNTESTVVKNDTTFIKKLQEEFQDLLSGDSSKLETRQQMLKMTEEKNKIAHNYLGLYGFLNLIAIGLMIYIAGGPTK